MIDQVDLSGDWIMSTGGKTSGCTTAIGGGFDNKIEGAITADCCTTGEEVCIDGCGAVTLCTGTSTGYGPVIGGVGTIVELHQENCAQRILCIDVLGIGNAVLITDNADCRENADDCNGDQQLHKGIAEW